MKPGRQIWPAIAALLLLAVLAGCRVLPTPPAPPPTAVGSAEELLARLQNRQAALKSCQARGRITLLSP